MSHDPNTERDHRRCTRDAILAVLEDLGGQASIAKVGELTGFGYGKIAIAVNRSPLYFRGRWDTGGHLVALSLHPHLLQHHRGTK